MTYVSARNASLSEEVIPGRYHFRAVVTQVQAAHLIKAGADGLVLEWVQVVFVQHRKYVQLEEDKLQLCLRSQIWHLNLMFQLLQTEVFKIVATLKALALGASAVMCGSMFVETTEAQANIFKREFFEEI